MDRKGIIAIAIAIVVMAWSQYHYQQQLEQYKKAQAAKTAAAASVTPSAQPGATATASATPAAAVTAPKIAATPQEPEKTETVSTGVAAYTFTNRGGGIASVKLLKHQGGDGGENVVLNTGGSHPIGAILPQPEDTGDDTYNVTVQGDKVTCETTNPSGLQIVKTFTVHKQPAQEYRVDLDVTYTNRAAAPISNGEFYLYTGAAQPIHPNDPPMYVGLDWFQQGKNNFITTSYFRAGGIPFTGIKTSPAKTSYSESPGDVAWVGVRNQYFTSVIAPTSGSVKGVWGRPYNVKIEGKDLQGIEAFMEVQGTRLNPGQSMHQSYVVYTGPAEFDRLQKLGHGEENLLDLNRWWINRTIGFFLLRVMNLFYSFIGNYALSIILLTLIVRSILWPIQGRANKSMKRMQLVQPKMNELREKYKDDPQRMNQEMIKLYREYKINPAAGCLPALIQIPIFFGFYTMLGTAVELRNSHFLWVHDLSRPDTVFHLGGFPVNILPLCMAATMLIQMQLTPRSGDPAQQRMFMLMPLTFVLFTYNYASALALYYTVQNILSIVQLYVTRNQPVPALVKEPAGKKQRRGL